MRVQHIPVGEEYYLDKETYVRTPGNQPRLNIKDTSTPRHPITVLESGIDLLVRLHKLLTNVGNWNRGAVQAEAFSGTVVQGVVLVFPRDFRRL